jgi:hypothetical protein
MSSIRSSSATKFGPIGAVSRGLTDLVHKSQKQLTTNLAALIH